MFDKGKGGFPGTAYEALALETATFYLPFAERGAIHQNRPNRRHKFPPTNYSILFTRMGDLSPARCN